MKKLLTIFLLLAVAIGLTYYLASLESKKPNKNIKIRISVIPWPGYDLLYLAKKKGYFAEEGLDVELVEQLSATNQAVAFNNGHISAAATTINDALDNNVNWKNKMHFVSILDYSNGGDVIIGQENIKTMQDLKGKKVAVEDSALGDYMINRALSIAGMTLDDVEIVNLSFTDGVKSMINKEVDGFVGFPPSSTEIQNSIPVNIIFDSTKIPGEIVDVLAVNDDLLFNHPDKVSAMVRAWNKALIYSKENPDELFKIMAENNGLNNREEFEVILDEVYMPSIAEQKEIFKKKSMNATAYRIMKLLFSEEKLKTAPLPDAFIHDDIIKTIN